MTSIKIAITHVGNVNGTSGYFACTMMIPQFVGSKTQNVEFSYGSTGTYDTAQDAFIMARAAYRGAVTAAGLLTAGKPELDTTLLDMQQRAKEIDERIQSLKIEWLEPIEAPNA